MLFVYQTPAFENRLNRDFKTLTACVENLIAKIEKKQEYTGFVPFDECFFVKKKLMYKYRLIARSKIIDPGEIDDEEHELLVFHDLMIRKDPDYNNPGDPDCFCKNPEGYAKSHHYVTETFDQDCIEYCKKRLQEKRVIKPKKTTSDYENELLYGSLTGAQEETGNLDIYETREWVSSLKSEDNTDLYDTYLHRLYESVVDAVAKAACNDGAGWDIQVVEYGSGYKKYFSYYYNIDKMVFILGRIDVSEDNAVNYIVQQESLYEPFDKEKNLKKTLRSYPETIVQNKSDLSLWKDIEHEQSNNMSLSSEELKILNQSLNFETRDYPLFINGRAGSGKSTILQFLFTSYYFQYLKSENEDDACPVYFTYNEKLLTAARETVSNLLGNHRYIGSPSLSESEKGRITDKAEQSENKVFRNFTEFLLEVARFKKGYEFRDQYKIEFADFKKMFLTHYGKDRDFLKKVTPEICWHVIRTYIKGDSVDAIMDPEEFKSEKNRSVSEETFNLVYTKVWLPWYSTITLFADKGEGEFGQNVRPQFWDEQDLVRYILTNGEGNEDDSRLDQYFEEHSRFSAIFCDESQDFTHIELEAIPEMSLYLYRKVDRNYIKQIPFVFAGDPFQTLNPTGFSWEATKRGFVDIVARALDKKADHVSLNYAELKMNYRSAADIVKVSNAIQVVRAAKLNPDKLAIEPQLPWNDSQGTCLFFNWNDPEFWSWLKKNDNVSFILPCDSSNRCEFIESNPILQEYLCRPDHKKGEDSGYMYPVYSALDIKGLEYDKVVVFGFGDYDGDIVNGNSGRFKKLLDGNTSLQGDQNLEMEYFINRVYVAVTRSKKKLFILDRTVTDDNKPYSTFWDKLKKRSSEDSEAITWLTSILPSNCKKVWCSENNTVEGHLEVLQLSRSGCLDGESSGEDKEAFAEQLLREGIDGRNCERLDFALQRFSSIKGENSSKCNEIRSCMSYLKSDFDKASKTFDRAGYSLASNHCLFLAESLSVAEIYTRMKPLGLKSPDCEDSAEQALIRCCVEKTPSDNSFINALEKFDRMYRDYSRRSGHEIFRWKDEFERWENLFNEALKKLPGSSPKNTRINEREYSVAEKLLSQEHLQLDEFLVAQYLMHVRKYDDVIKIASDNTDPKIKALADRAAALKVGFPKNLSQLNAVEDYDTILDLFKENYAERGSDIVNILDATSSKIICKAITVLKPSFNEGYFESLFSKYIDNSIWDVYTKGLKSVREQGYREKNIQLVWDMSHADKAFSIKICENMKACGRNINQDSFNLFYIYCSVAANKHPKGMDLKSCAGSLKSVFFNDKDVFSSFDLSVNDVLAFGTFYEYIADCISDKADDKTVYWKRALEFYNKALQKLGRDNLMPIQKRVIFCDETLFELYSQSADSKSNLTAKTKLHSDAEGHRDSSKANRKAWGINDKIEKIGKDDSNRWLNEMICKLWREDGYLIKHATAPVQEIPVENSNVIKESIPVEVVSDIQEKVVEQPTAENVKEEQPVEEIVSALDSSSEAISVMEQGTDVENVAEELPAEESSVDMPSETVVDNLQMEMPVEKSTQPELAHDTDSLPAAMTSLPASANVSFHLNLNGYTLEGSTDEDGKYVVKISVTAGPYLGSVDDYGFSPKRQKNFDTKHEPEYKYGDLSTFKVESEDERFAEITIGTNVIRVNFEN